MSDRRILPGMPLDGSLSAAARDDRVEFTFEVTNPDEDPIDLQFSDAQEADLAIADADGTEVWRWSVGRMFAQMLQRKQLDPDETATYGFEWENPEPGEYEARATLEASNADCEATTAFTV
ncbi:MAG: hypothetical protein ACI9YT_000974 [Halobacteriales archaeon]|jgi:hypothetical protein